MMGVDKKTVLRLLADVGDAMQPRPLRQWLSGPPHFCARVVGGGLLRCFTAVPPSCAVFSNLP